MSAELRKSIDEPHPWSQRGIRNIILMGVGAERHKGRAVNQQENLGCSSAQFLELVVSEKFIEIGSGSPVALLDLFKPVLSVVRRIIFQHFHTCHYLLPFPFSVNLYFQLLNKSTIIYII